MADQVLNGKTGDNRARPVYLMNDSFNIAQGNVSNVTELSKFGRNSDIDTLTDPEDIWNGGGLYTGFPSEVETIEVFSSDAADTAAGTGLRTIRLFGLDANGAEQTEDVTLNGVTPVATTNTWSRMNRMYGLTAGSGGENAGQITARHTTTTANVFAVMPTGNRTQICAFTVPAGCTGYVKTFDPKITRASGAAGSADIAIMVREPNGLWQQRETFSIQTGGGGEQNIDYTLSLPELSDVVARVLSVSDNDTIATARFVYRCVTN